MPASAAILFIAVASAMSFWYPTGIVGRKRHNDRLVDVAPIGMMVALFGNQRGAGHEAERGIEIGEHEFARDRFAVLGAAHPTSAHNAVANSSADSVFAMFVSPDVPAAA